MMTVVPLPANEEARLTALYQASILDTEPEARFDRLTQLAAAIAEASMAMIGFVTADSCWPKSEVGCEVGEIAREHSLAAWVVAGNEPMIVPDLALEQRFSQFPLPPAQQTMRFYAGLPLLTADQLAIGVLALWDDQPRTLMPLQIKLLQEVAQLIMGQINLSGLTEALTEVHADRAQLKQQLGINEKLLERLEQHNRLQSRNIAALKTQLQEQQGVGEMYSLVARSSNDGIWDWDMISNKVSFDERWKEMLGYGPDDLSDSMNEWLDRIHPDDLELFNTEIEASLIGWTAVFKNEHRLQHRDGSYRWVMSRGLAAKREDGTVYRLAGSILDITDSKGAEQQLLHNAFHDILTGLPNRGLFMDRLKRSLNRTKYRPDYLFAALFLDLDRFKVINDSLGHQVGDELLVGIARRLEKCMRPGDMIARLGGDEFAVIIDNLSSPDDALQAAERLHQELTIPYLLSGREVYASASIGVALSQADHETAQDFLRAADTAMYHAKSRGRGCVELFDTEMHARALGQLQIETDLRRALEREEFRVFYQPIVATETRQVRGFEALVRWEHPEQGLLAPIRFMPVAEDTGLVIPIDQWVLRAACMRLRAWQEEFPMNPLLSLSVNLSGKQFAHPDLCDKVRTILDETGVIPLSIKLEITESSLVENPDAAAQILRQLKDLGVRISLDDFGTGYSSLSYLHRFPIDVLKIDRSFVNRMSVSKNSEIVRTIITLALNLGMEVIAEGVETEEQVSQLTSMRCDYVQGYLFSQPMRESAVQELLSITYPKSQRQRLATV